MDATTTLCADTDRYERHNRTHHVWIVNAKSLGCCVYYYVLRTNSGTHIRHGVQHILALGRGRI